MEGVAVSTRKLLYLWDKKSSFKFTSRLKSQAISTMAQLKTLERKVKTLSLWHECSLKIESPGLIWPIGTTIIKLSCQLRPRHFIVGDHCVSNLGLSRGCCTYAIETDIGNRWRDSLDRKRPRFPKCFLNRKIKVRGCRRAECNMLV